MNKTKDKIYEYLKKNGVKKPNDIFYHFSINRQMVHRHLKKLLVEKKIQKIGSAPHVFYSILEKKNTLANFSFNQKIEKILEQEFYYISPIGKEYFGKTGFILWCQKRNFDIQKKATEYLKIFQKYQKIRKNNLLDATFKIKKSFGKNICVEKLFYFDFYSIEIFGKTKIGQKLLYAKQSQDIQKINEISKTIKNSLQKLIQREKIEAVIFVPPTVPRQIQFMKVLEKKLNLTLPQIKVVKKIADIRVPQKTLKKMSDRIENAENTFFIDDYTKFKKVLIIDDAVGSGASINQIACKLKKNKNSQKVIGFAITGSLNDFEVISEV